MCTLAETFPTPSEIKAFILSEYASKKEFDLHEVYLSDLEPADLDLYDVVETMLDEKLLNAVSGSLEHSTDHSLVVLSVA